MCNDRDNFMTTEREIYILTVIPVTRGVLRDELHYYSGESVDIGSVVEAPLRNKNISAAVVKCENAKTLKTDLKKYPYEVKKIITPKIHYQFPHAFMRAAQETSRHFLAPSGQIVNFFFKPPFDKTALNEPTKVDQKLKIKKEERLVMQAPEEERVAFYKSLIREEFAKKSSLFFCLPSHALLENLALTLGKGIEEYTYILSGSQSKKEINHTLEKIKQGGHAFILLATPHFLSLFDTNFGTIILENEATPHYKTKERPFFDISKFIQFLADETGARLILADSLLSIETLYLKEKGAYLPITPFKYRLLKENSINVVDMRKLKGDQAGGILSQELIGQISKALAEKENLFLFVLRKGVSPTTVCVDCGQELICKECASPLVLYHPPIYLCHKCLKRYSADVRCSNCRSWRLNPIGIGLDKAEELLRSKFSTSPIYKIDGATVKNDKKAKEIMRRFMETPGSILLGTELGLNYLNKKIAYTGIISLDSLFALPDYSMSEKVFSILLRLSHKTEKTLLIQTRKPEEKIFQHFSRGNLLDFYRNEIEMREKFHYPPAKLLIKISLAGIKEEVEKELSEVKKILADYKPEVYLSMTEKVKGKERGNLLLRLAPSDWPNEILSHKLITLDPKITVEINPSTLL